MRFELKGNWLKKSSTLMEIAKITRTPENFAHQCFTNKKLTLPGYFCHKNLFFLVVLNTRIGMHVLQALLIYRCSSILYFGPNYVRVEGRFLNHVGVKRSYDKLRVVVGILPFNFLLHSCH